MSARSNLIASGKSILPHPRITELFDTVAGTKVPQSSTDGFEPETMYQTPVFLGGRRVDTFSYPKGILTNSADITDAELHIVPSHDWTMNILPLEEVVVSNRIARTALRGRSSSPSSSTSASRSAMSPHLWSRMHDSQSV